MNIRIISHSRHLLFYLFSFAAALAACAAGVNAETANAGITTAEIRYLDTDTKEMIYSRTIPAEEAINNNGIYDPPYTFEDENGEHYIMDTGHPGNQFEFSEVWDMTSRPEFYGCCVYYKKGALQEGETAVKVELRINSPSLAETDLIGIRYIDGLEAGGDFVYQPEQRVDSILRYVFHYFDYDGTDPRNCLAVRPLSEDVNKNVVTVYYTGQLRFVRKPLQYKYYDAVTGEVLKYNSFQRPSGEFQGITPEPELKTEDGRVYVFDSTDTRNLLSIDQFPEYGFDFFTHITSSR